MSLYTQLDFQGILILVHTRIEGQKGYSCCRYQVKIE